MLRTRVAVIAAGVLAVAAMGGPARADALGPSVTFFQAPIPIIGSVLSDSSGTPSISMKDGWTVFDSDGICSATVQVYSSVGGWSTIATFAGNASTTKYVGHYGFTIRPGGYAEPYITATDCLGNTSTNWDYVEPSLAQEGAASYSAGWTTSNCLCFSGGATEESSTVGKTANYAFSSTHMVSLVSEKASNRGSVSIYVDGTFQKTVSLYSATSINRVVVWNSKYLNASGSHTLTLKVASGRVDIDAFITSY
jgi:hypothetical protein